MTPRQALQQLVDFFDRVEKDKCPTCMHEGDVAAECKQHNKKWIKAMREARQALKESLN